MIVGFWGGIVSFGFRICPNRACMQLSLVLYSFFVLLLKERCTQVQALQQMVPDPKPVSGAKSNKNYLFGDMGESHDLKGLKYIFLCFVELRKVIK